MITLLLQDGFAELSTQDVQGSRRQLDNELTTQIRELTGRYESAVASKIEKTAELLDIGRALVAWLDGADGAFSRIKAEAVGDLLLEIRAPTEPTPAEIAVLRAPWEVLADDTTFLAVSRNLAPYRRLGKPLKPVELDEYQARRHVHGLFAPRHAGA